MLLVAAAALGVLFMVLKRIDELVCPTVYRKGAREVVRRLAV
ncbi:hypothetical protein SAMN05216486_11224 [bacterium JGI 053]|nr:hypothetical protein SAMN05216486_11224 [bacterium JGI 053]